MKVFVTGGTGFIGGEVVRQLRARGDEVELPGPHAREGQAARRPRLRLVPGDLGDTKAIREGMEGCDAVIHAAAMYEVGIPASQRPAMREANVGGTERVLRAALEAGIPKVVYVSTVGIFGNTHGKVVDESYEHPGKDFTSCYEETKWEAHQVAKRMIARGGPAVHDRPARRRLRPRRHLLDRRAAQPVPLGKDAAAAVPGAGHLPLPRRGHRDGDHPRSRQGQDGRDLRHQRAGDDHARGDRRRRRRHRAQGAEARAPDPVMKAMMPIGPLVGKMMGQPPNLRELISSADGVTFWASHEKASRELGYEPRGLEQGLRETLEAEGNCRPPRPPEPRRELRCASSTSSTSGART